ncbi:MAG: hypothetical protein HY654_02315 [Acidobacteria bacterium]|nr:hypothetical protein [Acidobacteriota bacterium]
MCLLVSSSASAQTPADQSVGAVRMEVERLRQEFEAIRQQYGARLSELETRLAALEGRAPQPAQAAPPPAAPAEAAVPPGAAGAGGPTGSLPLYGNVNLLSKIFNPDIAVIGDFEGASGNNAVNPQSPLSLEESELSLQAIVDPYARADIFFSFGPEGVEVEEGFVTFPTLPGGFLAKVGKMRASVGKVNAMHTHVLPWIDRPLVTENLVGADEGLSDAGISVSRLITNPWVFLEATGEVYRGQSEVFSSATRGDLTYVGRLRGYQDLSESSNVDIGVSVASGGSEFDPARKTTLFGVDATFRYRPLRRAIYRRFIARTEAIWSRRPVAPVGDTVRADSFGAYVSADYQVARRWFAGGRYDVSERALDASVRDRAGSVLLTFWPSEFSQIRGQFRRIRFGDAPAAHEFLFQFLFSIGAHGAHVF